MDFKEKLGKELIFFDGAMGTSLQEKGLEAGELPEIWNIIKEETVYGIHRSYVESGSDIITANTFGANRFKMNKTGYSVRDVIFKAIEIAKKAARENSRKIYTALDIGPLGKLLHPFGDLSFDDAYNAFSEMIVSGSEAGADIILIETMNDLYEIKAAMLAAKENSDLPVIATFTPDEKGKLLTGADILTSICLIEGLGADGVGFNCGLGPKQMKTLFPELIKYSSLPIIISPNAGIPSLSGGKTVYDTDPEQFASHMLDFVSLGACIIGGCCGTTPEHIKRTTEKCRGVKIKPVTEKIYTAVSSYGKTVILGERTVIIGERINPTGKPRMKQALRENDIEYLYNEGLEQIDHGAEILDVNVGLPEIDEPAVLAGTVVGLQSITNTPLQIDTSNTEAMERALRLYNGKPLLNSVNGKKESFETILPLVKKYGAAVVALTLDERGVPETAKGRIEIAEKIIKAAESYGINKKDIVIDALAMTISTNPDNARITLEALEYIKNTVGVHTILGISNVSFGLPERGHINAAFFTLAMKNGLSAGIVNPLNPAMMNAYYAYQAISGNDTGCYGYIEKFSKESFSAAKDTENVNLFDAVVKGLKEQAEKSAADMIRKMPPIDIINNYLVPALDEVGKSFEQNKIFLPQLLMSAEAAKTAFETIKSKMPAKSGNQDKRGRIILATVKGDIHDIGKNIVKVLLENYNFDIIDLGKNVEPDLIAETALKENVRLIGLSALMTTTVSNMEKTIRLVKERIPDCLVMVGGAVLTEEYAMRIGADFYSKDALNGVRYANEIFK